MKQRQILVALHDWNDVQWHISPIVLVFFKRRHNAELIFYKYNYTIILYDEIYVKVFKIGLLGAIIISFISVWAKLARSSYFCFIQIAKETV